ncbi:hypothetical protein QYE76_066085 [Lolium multiflorum]|uniref:CCHC-type domain-containing protein n=1 Tax=Lolium multiflorum TaxID=4521 RepID=A0AAD8SAE1_LOLMU|nr:hypothetical protein QYE76_066085 [Lolium multiflorum]
MFKAALFSILGDNIVDPYMAFDHGKDAWDALEAKFGVSDAGTELYVMEQYYDYRMTDERSVVEQAHEIQSLAKELEQFKCTLPDKFVAGGIIAKLPPSWRNFATSLKHKRQEFSVSDLIGSLHVEEKARAKDTRARSFEGGSSANVVQKKNFQSHKSKNKNNGKGKFDEKNKASNSTNFKRKTPYKKKGNCHVCGAPGHWAPDCPERHDRRGNSGKSANVVIGVDTEMKDVGYGTSPTVLSVARTCSVLMGNGSRASVRGVEHFENPVEDDNEAPKRSKRQRTAKSFGHDFIVYLVDDTPTSISEAYASLDADYWKEAVRSEMDSILANGTWEITDRPYGCKPVGCKWVFKKKLRPDGTIEKYKARLVAKGYTQKEGEDFFDTYSHVARLTTIRVLLSLAASHGLLVHQMDVKTAFLNGELEEEIYMEQPDGFVVDGQEGKVCKLLKSLYGLKQAPKQWHEKFERTLTAEGFVVNEADKCVYYRHGGGEGVILCLYVDDILIFGTNLTVIKEVKEFLSRCFEMKDLGVADVILNIKLLKDDDGGITLLQSHYVEKILSRFGYSDCKSSPTPYDPSVIIRTASYGIHYTGYPRVLEGYSDANWISDADETKATSGYLFTLGGGAVSWKSCKQTIITRSTMEAELTALDTATVEAEWLRELLMDLPVVEKPIPAIPMNCDNQTVIVKVFGERSGATTGITTSSSDDEFLHTDNFFPDLSDFFDNLNMGDNDAAAKIRNIRTSDNKINKTPNKMAITCGIRKRITISRTKLNIKLHRSINRALIPKSSTSKKILNVLLLRDRKAIRSGGNLNPKKIAKRTKISHEKLITKTSLYKGNILRIITSNDHIINIEKEKGASTRRSVNEKCWIMKTRRETSSSHHRGKALKPGTRGLFETIERTSKTTNHPIGNRIPRRRLHVNLLTQLAIKKSILNIKLGDRPAANRSNSKKGTHSSHMSHRGKSLIIVTTVLLLKATSHKTRFIALKRSIRASLNFIDPLTCDGTNTRRGRNKIPSDIGIPNGPAKDGTRGLLKAQDSKNEKIRKLI